MHSMRNSRGFTLVEIAVVIVIVAMVIALFASMTTALMSSQRRQTTNNHLAMVDAALVQFVIQNQRLPCPAMGTLASGVTNAGLEVAGRDSVNGCPDEVNGVVPWATLGMAESDATDGWGRRITYRVSPPLAGDNAMNMFWCDPAGTGSTNGAQSLCLSTGCNTTAMTTATTACTSPANFLGTAVNGVNKGLQVQDTGGNVVMAPPANGAAYVLISAGESGGGAYTGGGGLAPSTTTDGTLEQVNYANKVLQPAYVDGQTSDVAGAATHFDDVVVRPTVLSVITRAGLGPRAH